MERCCSCFGELQSQTVTLHFGFSLIIAVEHMALQCLSSFHALVFAFVLPYLHPITHILDLLILSSAAQGAQ